DGKGLAAFHAEPCARAILLRLPRQPVAQVFFGQRLPALPHLRHEAVLHDVQKVERRAPLAAEAGGTLEGPLRALAQVRRRKDVLDACHAFLSWPSSLARGAPAGVDRGQHACRPVAGARCPAEDQTAARSSVERRAGRQHSGSTRAAVRCCAAESTAKRSAAAARIESSAASRAFGVPKARSRASSDASPATGRERMRQALLSS